jgi:hypothetical protein
MVILVQGHEQGRGNFLCKPSRCAVLPNGMFYYHLKQQYRNDQRIYILTMATCFGCYASSLRDDIVSDFYENLISILF